MLAAHRFSMFHRCHWQRRKRTISRVLRMTLCDSVTGGSLHLPSPCHVAQNLDISQVPWYISVATMLTLLVMLVTKRDVKIHHVWCPGTTSRENTLQHQQQFFGPTTGQTWIRISEVCQGSAKAGTSYWQGFHEWHDQKAAWIHQVHGFIWTHMACLHISVIFMGSSFVA